MNKENKHHESPTENQFESGHNSQRNEHIATCIAMAGVTVALRATGEIIKEASVSEDCTCNLELPDSPDFLGFCDHLFCQSDPEEIIRGHTGNLNYFLIRRMLTAQLQAAMAADCAITFSDPTSQFGLHDTKCHKTAHSWANKILDVFADRLDIDSVFANFLWLSIKEESSEVIGSNWAIVFENCQHIIDGRNQKHNLNTSLAKIQRQMPVTELRIDTLFRGAERDGMEMLDHSE